MPPRKRVRKRKRRNASSSSSDLSSSSESTSSSDEKLQKNVQLVVPAREKDPPIDSDSDSDSDSDTSDSSRSRSSRRIDTALNAALKTKDTKKRHSPSQSPAPPDGSIPSMFPPSTSGPSEKEEELKEKFKKFWMSSIADAYKDELEEIRKEPNLTTPRLSLLIDALASGADVYASTDDPALNEMEIVLKDLESRVP